MYNLPFSIIAPIHSMIIVRVFFAYVKNTALTLFRTPYYFICCNWYCTDIVYLFGDNRSVCFWRATSVVRLFCCCHCEERNGRHRLQEAEPFYVLFCGSAENLAAFIR